MYLITIELTFAPNSDLIDKSEVKNFSETKILIFEELMDLDKLFENFVKKFDSIYNPNRKTLKYNKIISYPKIIVCTKLT